MSLITRCPACTTLFKVVPDQLRVSEGWVRCGQCDEVFDANAHLQGDSPAQVGATAQSPSSGPTAEERLSDVPQAFAQEPNGVDTEPQMPPDPTGELEQAIASQLEWPEQPAVADYDALLDVRPGAASDSDLALHLELPGDVSINALAYVRQVPEPEESFAEQGEGLSQIETRLDTPTPVVAVAGRRAETESKPAPAPTFMRSARKTQSPWVRWSLWAMTIFLAAGLMAQGVWHERDRLAANVPDLRPALIAMCSALACEISPFKQIDTVVIDTSSFVKIRGDVYRLNITLKNIASIDIAAPAVELTLTDLQDQPMIRQVLSASQLGAQQGIIAAGAELTTGVPVQVKSSGSADRISGYRLLAFYP